MQPDNLRRLSKMLFPPYAIVGYLLWTFLIAGQVLADMLHRKEQVITFATAEARADWDKDQAFRRWATRHGGVYVKPDSRTPPNRYLARLKNRDIETTNGMKLTLMNPAYMMRQMTAEYEEMYGVKGSITGQVLLNPINKADPWELAALKRFDKGEKEVVEKTDINGQPYLRLMKPTIMEAGCVKCHGHLGFKEGDIRGGVSVSIPMKPYYDVASLNQTEMFITQGGIWFVGLFGIGYISVRRGQRDIERKEASATLEVSQENIRFQAHMLEQMSEGVLLTSNDATILYVNAATEKLFGYDEGEMTGMPISRLNHPDGNNPLETANEIMRILNEKGEWQGEIQNIKKDGTSIWCFATVSSFTHPEYGDVWLGTQRDITERRLAAQKVNVQAKIIDQIHDSVISTDLNGYITSWNRGAEKIFGYSRDEMQGEHISNIYPEEDRALLEREVIKPLLNKGEHDLESRMLRKNNEIFYAQLSLSLQYDENNNAIGMIGYCMDITARKKAEERVQQLAAIVRHSSDFIGFADLKGHPQYINEAGRKMIGIENEEQFSSCMVLDFFPEETREFVENKVIPQVLETGHWVGEVDFRHFHSGEIIPIWYDMFRINDSVTGEAINFATITRDIREKKATEQELNRYREHLEELVKERTKELRDAQGELVRKERLATLGQLTATVSHELRNPLGAMRPSLFIIDKDSDKTNERVQRAIEIVDKNIERCDNIIDELLDYTRITTLDRKSTHIDEWLELLIDEQNIIGNIRVEKNFSLNDLELNIDPDRLRRAVINIVDNACHSMLNDKETEAVKDSCLCINTIANNQRIEIIVSDNGIGITKDTLEKIFEPLFSTKGFGVGLGMPTVKQIMEQHGGGIEIESEAGKGTSVTLWLPEE